MYFIIKLLDWTQVRIEGKVEKITTEASDEYFHSRPRSSQIGACVSAQSQPIQSKQVLLDIEENLSKEFCDESTVIPKPENWFVKILFYIKIFQFSKFYFLYLFKGVDLLSSQP